MVVPNLHRLSRVQPPSQSLSIPHNIIVDDIGMIGTWTLKFKMSWWAETLLWILVCMNPALDTLNTITTILASKDVINAMLVDINKGRLSLLLYFISSMPTSYLTVRDVRQWMELMRRRWEWESPTTLVQSVHLSTFEISSKLAY
jgi:hypothetical protein